MDVQQLERAVVSASQGSSESAVLLDAARRQSPDGLARECLHLLSLRGWAGDPQPNQQFDSVAFYALSTIQRSPILQCNNQSGDANFVSLRHQLKQNLLHTISTTCLRVMPSFIATKVGVLLALLVREEYPSYWPNPFLDVMAALHLAGDSGHQDKHSYLMHLCFLDALSDEIVYPSVAEDSSNGNLQAQRVRREQVKDAMRGFAIETADTGHTKPSISIERTEAAVIAGWLSETLAQTSNSNNDDVLEIAVKTAATLKRYVSWIELSLASNPGLVSLLYSGLGHASPGSSDDDEMPTHRTLLSVECSMCLREITVRGMDEEKKLSLLIELNLFPLLSQMTNAQTSAVDSKLIDCRLDFSDVDATQVEALAATAELTNSAGLELIQGWENDPSSVPASRHMEHCLEMAMLCLSYDSIDVSGPVIELIARCLNSIEKKETEWNTSFGASNGETVCDKVISRILEIVGTRMAYPSDFRFDYEDEEESEEEMYRAQLRKLLFVRIVRLRKTAALHHVGVSLSALPQPLSSAPTSDMEVALRLVYHYAEGRRPAPGAKTALKQDVSFREIIIALHQSDVTAHPHREVLLLYYDIGVRYATILKDSPELLTRLLGALSGKFGLQHSHERVRSRCCYLLLRLVKSVGAEVMRPHVEPIVDGIQTLLFPQANSSQPASIPPNDALYLFEGMSSSHYSYPIYLSGM